jgi:CRP-like cAMP-binding protein
MPFADISNSQSPSPPLVQTNKLLGALSPDDRQRVLTHLVRVPLKLKQVLHKQSEPVEHVYFPGGGACSVMRVMLDGATAEVATIGNEGVVGAGVYFGQDIAIGETIVQVEGGSGFRMSVPDFRAEMDRRGAFYNLIVRYAQAVTSQVMQTAACNALHQVQQRACRWLLIIRDRTGRNDLKLTHEFLAIMLGVRRPTVTLIVGELEKAGLITTQRAMINIEDHARLEQATCECYAAAKANFARLLPEISGPVG